jgi:predicted RNA-binding protein associated with RNAse of E/G family
VNLQEPFRRAEHGVDTADQLLDLVRSRDGGRWRWKDEDQLEAAVVGGFVSENDAAAVRAEALRVIAADPFPTGWEDWQPDSTWPMPTLLPLSATP